MPLSALALVLVAAVIHASWNLMLKKADADPVCFSWLAATGGALALMPFALVFHHAQLFELGWQAWVAAVASGFLHVFYFITLQTGYRHGDLSVVYPVARGVGPLLSALAAILLLGEQATLGSLTGLALIVLGTFTIAGGAAMLRGAWSARTRAGLLWGASTGVLIAAYTVNDGRAVRLLGVAPLLFYWLSDSSRALLLLPAVARRGATLQATLRKAWRPAVGVALLSPFGYILVLQAMTIAPVSHVAPAREVSMLIAAFLGAKLLSEGELVRRLIGAALIAVGVACLALSG
ncbi:MAG: DMT family transporter [Quisquiliibacterium sp.]